MRIANPLTVLIVLYLRDYLLFNRRCISINLVILPKNKTKKCAALTYFKVKSKRRGITMLAKISLLFLVFSFGSLLSAETIRCKKTENDEEVFSMNSENLRGLVFSAGRTLPTACHIDDKNKWRCFAQSERDPLHSFEVTIAESSRFIEYYGRDFWAYPLTCEIPKIAYF